MSLRETILSRQNIYSAIYALRSYISEPYLLGESDLIMYHQLSDKFDFDGLVEHVMEKCEKELTSILNVSNHLFNVSVYFPVFLFCATQDRFCGQLDTALSRRVIF